jgi:hypothetical protein
MGLLTIFPKLHPQAEEVKTRVKNLKSGWIHDETSVSGPDFVGGV